MDYAIKENVFAITLGPEISVKKKCANSNVKIKVSVKLVFANVSQNGLETTVLKYSVKKTATIMVSVSMDSVDVSKDSKESFAIEDLVHRTAMEKENVKLLESVIVNCCIVELLAKILIVLIIAMIEEYVTTIKQNAFARMASGARLAKRSVVPRCAAEMEIASTLEHVYVKKDIWVKIVNPPSANITATVMDSAFRTSASVNQITRGKPVKSK